MSLLLLLLLTENLSQSGNDRIIDRPTLALLLEVEEGLQLQFKGPALVCFGGAAEQLVFNLGEQQGR